MATVDSGAMTTLPGSGRTRSAVRLLAAMVTLLTVPSVVLTGRASVTVVAPFTGKTVSMADMYSIGVASARALYAGP